MLGEVFAVHRWRDVIDSRLPHQLPGPALPAAIRLDKVHHLVDACRDACGGQVFRTPVAHEAPTVVLELEIDLAPLYVAPSDAEGSLLGVPAGLRENPREVRDAGDSVGAGDGVHHVAVAHLSRVVDEQHGNPMVVGEPL